MKSTPARGVKRPETESLQAVEPLWSNPVELRTFCIMDRRVTLRGKLKTERRRRSESESEQGVKLVGLDPKPDDLAMSRLKAR